MEPIKILQWEWEFSTNGILPQIFELKCTFSAEPVTSSFKNTWINGKAALQQSATFGESILETVNRDWAKFCVPTTSLLLQSTVNSIVERLVKSHVSSFLPECSECLLAVHASANHQFCRLPMKCALSLSAFVSVGDVQHTNQMLFKAIACNKW